MKLSIVTISFNQVKFLERTILSVINQENADFEYIVVDPGSTDGSRELLLEYKNNIDHLIFKPDSGPAQGLNHGFSFATGDIFGFLNSDDLYMPGTFEKVIELFIRNKHIDIIIGNGYLIDENDNDIRKIYSDVFSLLKYKLGTYNFIQASMFFRRSAFERISGFNEANKSCWDAELLVDMALAGSKVKRVNNFFAKFRVHADSLSVAGTSDLYNQDRKRISSKIADSCALVPNGLLTQVLRIINLLQSPQKIFVIKK